jgi:hypothetical protein
VSEKKNRVFKDMAFLFVLFILLTKTLYKVGRKNFVLKSIFRASGLNTGVFQNA